MKILLVCFAGMSTSIMMKKMKESAAKKKIDLDINAVPLSKFQDNLDGVNAILLGPQVRYAVKDVEKTTEGKIPVMVINSVDYGMMNGDKVLDETIKMVKDK
jgi:PTS system cellobiose-specific IIB component